MAEIFKPIRGSQTAINRYPIVEGQVLFAYDSGRIFLDKDGVRYTMSSKGGGESGGMGIIYANGSNTQIIPEDLSEHEPVNFLMDLAALEDPVAPDVDSLILNSDGRFFRVLGYNAATEKISVKLLAVSGSGGGSSGGGTAERDVDISWDNNTIATGHIFIYKQDYNVKFIPTTTAAGDINCNVTFNIINNDTGEINSITKNNLPSGVEFDFNTSILPESSNITLQIIVTSDNSQYNYGLGYQRNITGLRVIKMELEKPAANTYQPLVKSDDLSGQLTLTYRPIGDSSLPFTLHTYIDKTELGTGKNIPSSYLNQTVTETIPRQEHGVHTIKFVMTTVINGETIYSNAIEYEGAWATAGETRPIIWIGSYDKTVVNYENSYIKYMVFDPVNYSNGMPAEVHLLKDGTEVSQIDATYSDDDWLVWDISNLYTVTENQIITPNIFSITCGGTKVNIIVNITTEGSRDLGLVADTNLILNMTTAGRSSNEIKRNRGVFKSTVNTNTITATLNNFNWQNNGWKDSDGVDKNGVDSGAYLSIANGASLSIAMAGNGLILNGSKDYSFEIRFRVKNVQEYSTLVKIVPKYFYMVPDPNNPGEWMPTYSISVSGEDEIITGDSLFESEIIANGFKIGVDQYGNLLMDEANSIKTTESHNGVICRWLGGNSDADFGFCIGTQEAYFRTPSGVTNVRYCEDEVINLAMVASKTDSLCYIYLNGILSGAVAMPTGTGSAFTINTPFTFNSNYCDFDLYRFRIYELGLTMPQVIHNYLSDMHSIVLYDQNQITNPLDPTALSYPLLVQYNENHKDMPSMPYATWQITDGTDEMLSYKKGNNRAATVEFVNPPLDVALENEEITPWFYYTHCPSFYAEKVDLNVQGTSSQKYPRRNYKLKYKSAKDTWVYTQGPLAGYPLTSDYYFLISTGELVTKEVLNEETNEIEIVPIDKADYNSATMKKLAKKYHMDTEDFGTNKFTWKIDYMESSETYNTGFANLMGNLIHPLYTKHPLDDLNQGIDTSDMRTTVYGFPVLTFHKYSNGQYEYVGKYNMNLDKSSNEYYGFEDETPHPFVPLRTKKVLNKTTNEYEDVEYRPTIAEIAECWELKDNQGNWCSFKYPDAASRATGFMTLKEGTSGDSAQLEILNHYEYRYSYYGDQLDAAYEYAGFTDPDTQVTYSNNGQINTYLYEKHRNFEKLFNWLDSTNLDTATNNQLTDSESNPITVTYQVSSISDDPTVTYTEISSGLWDAVFTADTREYRRQKFKAELSSHLDKEYCLTYYVLTELLLCYDSRGKNCMMATFGPQREGGEYIWYPIFYDIDTQLGLNNSGDYLRDYDADVTKDNLFSTPTSVLWNNLYDLFYDDIVQKYRVLRGVSNPSSDDEAINGSLTYENIAGAYECNANVFNSYAMAGVRPIVAVGLDEYYKYMAPALTAADYAAGKLYAGYYDTSGVHKYQTRPTYAYCAQGDKKLTTELLLRNRLNYIDSWWMGGDYRAGVVENQIFLRGNANMHDSSDLFLDDEACGHQLPAKAGTTGKTYSLVDYPKEYFDARPGFKIKPFLHQYVSYFHDSQPSVPVKYDGSTGQEDGVWTNVDSGKLQAYKTQVDYSQQIQYIPGGDYISSLGDLSLSYGNAFQVQHGQRLLDLRLGSDVPGYINIGLTSRQGTDFELTNMPLLKFVNVSKLSLFNDEMPELVHSEKLQEFRALGSIIERTNFAPGAPLHTVHLPATMTTISLVQHQELTDILTTQPKVCKWVNKATQEEVEFNLINDWSTVELVTADPADYRGLYLEGVTDYTSLSEGLGHNITTLKIDSGGLGYNSYIILKNLYDLKNNLKPNATKSDKLSIGLTDVMWTPYEVVEKGTPYDSNETFYLLNDHSTYEPYVYESDLMWNDQLNRGIIYTYNTNYVNNEENTITNLDLLDAFIDQYEAAKTAGTESQFSNLVNTTEATIPTITGYLYVNNDNEHKINETDLTDVYAKYFPYLSISAKYIKESNVTKYVRIYEETGVVEVHEIIRSDGLHPEAPIKAHPSKAGYDFIGWSTDPEGQNMFLNYEVDVNTGEGTYVDMQEALDSYTFTEQNNVLVLYAQFEIQKKIIRVYIANELVGAAVVPEGSVFTNPVELYECNSDGSVNTDVSFGFVPYKNDSNLDLTKTYIFRGYSTESIGDIFMDIPVPNPPPTLVESDMNVYGVFSEGSVYNNILDERYLTFNANDNIMQFNFDTISSVKGKITLPLTYNGQPVGMFGSDMMTGQAGEYRRTAVANITHIFWEQPTNEKPCYVYGYTARAFAQLENLLYVEIPVVTANIDAGDRIGTFELGAYCFNRARNLFNNSKITEQHKQQFIYNITYFGNQSFSNVAPTQDDPIPPYFFLNNVAVAFNPGLAGIGSSAFSNTVVKQVIFGAADRACRLPLNLFASQVFATAGHGTIKYANYDSTMDGQYEPVRIIFYYSAEDAAGYPGGAAEYKAALESKFNVSIDDNDFIQAQGG